MLFILALLLPATAVGQCNNCHMHAGIIEAGQNIPRPPYPCPTAGAARPCFGPTTLEVLAYRGRQTKFSIFIQQLDDWTTENQQVPRINNNIPRIVQVDHDVAIPAFVSSFSGLCIPQALDCVKEVTINSPPTETQVSLTFTATDDANTQSPTFTINIKVLPSEALDSSLILGHLAGQGSWQLGAWSTCDRPAGGGNQFRSVSCSLGGMAMRVEAYCQSTPRPPSQQRCNQNATLTNGDYYWQTFGEVTPCLTQCAKGQLWKPNAVCMSNGLPAQSLPVPCPATDTATPPNALPAIYQGVKDCNTGESCVVGEFTGWMIPQKWGRITVDPNDATKTRRFREVSCWNSRGLRVYDESCLDIAGQPAETQVFINGNGPPAESCSDNIHNGDEQGIDCGGSCNPCGNLRANLQAVQRLVVSFNRSSLSIDVTDAQRMAYDVEFVRGLQTDILNAISTATSPVPRSSVTVYSVHLPADPDARKRLIQILFLDANGVTAAVAASRFDSRFEQLQNGLPGNQLGRGKYAPLFDVSVDPGMTGTVNYPMMECPDGSFRAPFYPESPVCNPLTDLVPQGLPTLAPTPAPGLSSAKSNAGAIGGGIAAAIVFVIVVAAILIHLQRRKRAGAARV